MSDLCLVTGGAGFIGSHLVEGLTATGRRVRVLDDLSTGLADNLAHIQPTPELINGNICDADALKRAMEGVSVVFHLAALASVQLSVENPPASHRVCATGTLEVLDAARKADVRRVVYAGSSSAYGVGGEVQKETDPLHPLSPYAAAKLAGEMYMQAFTTSFGLETVRLRFFNVYGPRQRDDSPYSGVIAIFTGKMSAGIAPTVFGDGLQTRDFVYVSDVVQALIRASEAPAAGGQVYNVGTGRGTSVLDLVDVLNRLLGTKLSARHADLRAGDVRHSRADISRARVDLGYEPRTTLEEGMAKTLAWYRERK
jgi:UDP-glucose 4-epimerase